MPNSKKGTFAKRGGIRRVNLIDQSNNKSEDSTEEVENMVLQGEEMERHHLY